VLNVRQIYVTALINGAAGVVFMVTQVATVPRLVPEDQLGPASGQAELIWNVSAVVGPPLAGLLLTAWLALPMLADAISFAVVGCVVLGIRTGLNPDSPPLPTSLRKDLTVGIRKLAARKQLRAMTAITITGDFLFGGITVLMTVLLKHSGAPPSVIGVNFSLAAIGGVVGSLLANPVERRLGMVTSILIRSWTVAILFPLLALSVVSYLLGVIWCAINVTIALMNVVQMRYMMTSIPNEVLGRVQSFMTLLAYAVLPIGMLLTGTLLEGFGPRATVLCYAGVLLVVAFYASVSKSLRASGNAEG
jgi:MFS family permease